MREQLRNRAVLLVAILAVALALLGAYTWNQTAPTRCPKARAGACLPGQTHRVHPLRARIEWAAAVVLVVGAASLAVTGRRRRRG